MVPRPNDKTVVKTSRRDGRLLSAALLTLALTGPVSAQTYTWQPNAGPTNPFWNLAANWQGGVVPTSGIDTNIQFGQSAAEQFSTQNIGFFTLNSLTVGSVASGVGGLSILGSPLIFAASSTSLLPTLTQNNAKSVSVANDIKVCSQIG